MKVTQAEGVYRERATVEVVPPLLHVGHMVAEE